MENHIFSKSIFFSGIGSIFRALSFGSIKTRFKAFWEYFVGPSISIVYTPNMTRGVVIQWEKWSVHQGASFGIVYSHPLKKHVFSASILMFLWDVIPKNIIFLTKLSFEICSKQLSTMRNRFLILTNPEKLYFNESLRF